MKKIYYLIFSTVAILLIAYNLDFITDKIAILLKHQPTVIISNPNEYYKNNNYKFVQESIDFIPYSKQDIKNIFYSILNNGYYQFTFYCPSQYLDCNNDVNKISTDSTLLTHINNFISPFNNFSSIKVINNKSGEINVEVTKAYQQLEIDEINQKIDYIMQNYLTNDMTLEDKILTLHDYIINNTKYDQDRINGTKNYKSNIAYGPLIQNYAICGGYADAMALFLNRLNVPNFKVASDTHVWNAIFINNQWRHLDLTWDDPVSQNSNNNNLIHKFYLIDTFTLQNYDIEDHDYDQTIYQEL
ncbi:MAG: hypothetical protein PHS24_04275 [Bacilli bacterium]|nr:hypothetical protein [Bacilli bacterium]